MTTEDLNARLDALERRVAALEGRGTADAAPTNDGVVTYQSPEQLTTLIERYMADPDARRAIAERGRAAVVGRHMRFYGRLRDRMDRLGWPPADPVRRDVERAWERVYGLSVRLHDASCPDQTFGRQRPPQAGG